MNKMTKNRSGNTRESLVDRAYSEIKRRILDNQMSPGFQALDSELADELGVSRTPIREALLRLQHEGLVELIPRRGMRVVPVVASDMKEIYEVLTALESMAVDLLARQEPSTEILVPMRKAIEDMGNAVSSSDLESWAAADEDYHRSLFDLCGNRRLAVIAATMRDQSYRARMVTLRLRAGLEESYVEHRDILELIARGDWEGARKLHYLHRLRASSEVVKILETFRLAQF